MQLDKARIVAPFSGIVGLRRVSAGEYITAGQALVNLEAIDPVKADFRVPEKFLPAIRVGQTIRIKVDAFPDAILSRARSTPSIRASTSPAAASSSAPWSPTPISVSVRACSRA